MARCILYEYWKLPIIAYLRKIKMMLNFFHMFLSYLGNEIIVVFTTNILRIIGRHILNHDMIMLGAWNPVGVKIGWGIIPTICVEFCLVKISVKKLKSATIKNVASKSFWTLYNPNESRPFRTTYAVMRRLCDRPCYTTTNATWVTIPAIHIGLDNRLIRVLNYSKSTPYVLFEKSIGLGSFGIVISKMTIYFWGESWAISIQKICCGCAFHRRGVLKRTKPHSYGAPWCLIMVLISWLMTEWWSSINQL